MNDGDGDGDGDGDVDGGWRKIMCDLAFLVKMLSITGKRINNIHAMVRHTITTPVFSW